MTSDAISEKQFLDHYNIDFEKALSMSCYGAVYKAYDRAKYRYVAIKSNRCLTYYSKEIFLLQSLQGYQYVPRFFDSFIFGESGYIVMELCGIGNDDTIFSVVNKKLRRTPLKSEVAIGIIVNVLSIIDSMHNMGYLHSDIHPLNVLLDKDCKPESTRLIDFGISPKTDNNGNWRGEVNWGLWEFMPPEQFPVMAILDHSTDTYLAGSLLYYYLTGRPPYELAGIDRSIDPLKAKNMFQMARLKLPNTHIVDSRIKPVIDKSLSNDNRLRYQSAQEMSQELVRTLELIINDN